MPRSDAETRLVRLKWRRAFDRWRGKAALLVIAVKGGFDPNQPRVPAGNPDGGQWTGGGDGTGGRSRSGTSRRDRADDRQRTGTDLFRNPDKPRVNLAQGRGRGRGGRVPVRVGNRLQFVTPEEKIELVSAKGQAKRAVERVKELEPDWEPLKGKIRSSLRGAIDEAYDIRYQAEARLIRHGRQSHKGLIDLYRDLNRAPDLFNIDRFDRDKSTVAFGLDNGRPLFGVNSDAPPYTSLEFSRAISWRSSLIEQYPDVMNTNNIGQFPNNSVFHAEATVLFKFAEANGGTLRGQGITIYAERMPCPSCEDVLPLISRQLGRPTITFVDLRTGKQTTIRDGNWE